MYIHIYRSIAKYGERYVDIGRYVEINKHTHPVWGEHRASPEKGKTVEDSRVVIYVYTYI